MPDFQKITRADIEEFKTFTNPEQGGANALDVYQHIATKTAVYPGEGSPFGLMYVSLKMNGEAGEFAEHVGKAMRDDSLGVGMEYGAYSNVAHSHVVYEKGLELTPERKLALIKEVGDVLWYLSAACNELGITLSQAALQNLEKLCDRTERGKLSGSGDNR